MIETVDSNLRDFCKVFQSLTAENVKEKRPKEVRAFVGSREINLLERRLNTGTDMVIKVLR